MNEVMLKINVNTEWGKLKEVVVGSCYNITDVNVDASFRLFFLKNITDPLVKNSVVLQRRMIEQRQEDLDNFAKKLFELGVNVHRPKKLEIVQKFKTPHFEDHLCPVDNPRDQNLIIGDQIIETSCQWRRRYFENDLMKEIYYKAFHSGARWVSSPRPMMCNDSFDFTNMPWEEDPELRSYKGNSEHFEIMFDGAQCLKFGKDIIMNISTKNHELGFNWLERHLNGQYKIHPVKITDHHIDGMMMPLKPGVLLINANSMENNLHLLPKGLQKWKILKVPRSHIEEISNTHFASDNINVNVLPLDHKRLIVFTQSGEPDIEFCELLVKNGFEPINIQLRHSRMFGGGAHCVTLDLNREDEAGKYF